MRTKLFLAFLTVIITALISNLIFERLIIRDFDDYSMGMREDRLYWILASVEGNHSDGSWNTATLSHILLWGTMLGLDLKVIDTEDSELLTTGAALRDVSTTMRRRIESLVVLDSASGEFEEYPLFVEGEEIGTLMVREFQIRGGYDEKEKVFKRRGRNFLMISFLIAGGGALFLAIALSLFLTGPLRRLRLAAEKVASGDFSGRVKYRSGDEVGRLITSFNKMVESLEREEALRQRLTQNVAHELRTPLTVMRSHLEAVADGIVDCSPKAMDTLMAEVKRLVNLVEGIEDMTKAEASFFKPAKTERMALSEFIEGVLGGLRPLFSEKGLELKVDVEQAAQADMDTDKLYTVLKNILT
ncbi:MAG TPA: HAMP domain-containing protein, partial [Nitrospirae bacterium]|nr:HAMP domain-containing protein [Nitrospirota bacterium]